MTAMDAGYRLGVSPIELRWLAAAFGMASLPLPGDPLRHMTDSQVDALLKEVPAALEARGWIRRTGRSGWQVDRLPAAVVQWMGKAEAYLAADSQIRDAPSRRMNVFFAGEAAMSVAWEGDAYGVVLYPSMEVLASELLFWIGAPSASMAGNTERLSIPQPLEFLRIAWSDPKILDGVLKITGANARSGGRIREWADALRWAADLTAVNSGLQDAKGKGGLFLCGGDNTVWMGTPSEDSSKLVLISAVTERDAREAVRKMIGKVDRIPPIPTSAAMERSK